MEAQLHRRIQHEGWNHAAPYYDTLWEAQLRPARELLLSMAALQSGEWVLDVACGTGLVTFEIARRVSPQGKVTATDFSESMLEIACDYAREYQLPNISFQHMDAEKLDFPEGTFDAVLNALGFMYLLNPQQALKEMYRVVKPGGRAAVLVWGARDKCGWAEVFPIIQKRVATEVCPMFFQQGTNHTLLYEFDKAGFVVTEEKRFSTFIHYENDCDAGDALFIGGPVALAWKHFDEKKRNSAREEYLQSLAPYKNDNGYNIPVEFVVVKGEKMVDNN